MVLLERQSDIELWMIRNTLVNSNTYVLRHKNRPEELLIIDPGSNTDEIQKEGNFYKDSTYSVVLTHGHFDHVVGINALPNSRTKIYMALEDEPHLKRNNFYLKALGYDYSIKKFSWLDIDKFIFPDANFFIHLSPGHTLGSRIIQVNDWYFTGDSVLANSIAAPTVKGNNLQMQLSSVKKIFKSASNLSMIYPGHGKPDTLPGIINVNLDLANLLGSRE